MNSDVIKVSAPAVGEFWKVEVLFEDDHLLALNKPARLLVAPDRDDSSRPALMTLLHEAVARGAEWASRRGISYLANARRLDFETSGVLLLAKNKSALVALANQFGAEKPVEASLALVQGSPSEPSFEIDKPLSRRPGPPPLTRVDLKAGKKSRTRFELLESFAGFSLLRCRPLTVRPDQIRAHLRSARLPLVGDELYGGFPLMLSSLKANYRQKKDRLERPLIGRAALHVDELTILHPVRNEPVAIRAPWPRDLTAAVKYLRKFASGSPAEPETEWRP